jgi:hypothetical protein
MLTNQSSSDVLRTHCPGPLAGDIVGMTGNPAYARGAVAATKLLGSRPVVSLTTSGSFAGFGYSGSRGGMLRFQLTRVSLHAGTEGGS